MLNKINSLCSSTRMLILIILMLMISTIPIFIGTKYFIFRTENIFIENSVTPPSKLFQYSLEDRNNKRWQNLEDQYRFLNLTLLTNPSLISDKTIIYQCQSVCGGLGDRIRGLIMCYFLSILLNRQLVVDMEQPCRFTNYFQPNKYQWKSASGYNFKGSRRHIVCIDYNDQLANELKTTAFIDSWSKYDNIKISINIDFIQEIFSNVHLQSHPIIAMFLKEMSVGEANYQTLFSLFYEILLRPTQPIVQIIDNFLLNRSIEHLICTHLRIGRNPSNPRDHQFEYRDQITPTILDFLTKTKLLERNPRASLFVSSDSSSAIDEILQHFPHQSFSIPGPILQIDLPTNVDCDAGFTKVVADFYMLSECRTVILTNSGFSAYANRRRFDPYGNLFKYNQKQNQVQKCLDLRSPQGWLPHRSMAIKLFCPVQTSNYSLEDIL